MNSGYTGSFNFNGNMLTVGREADFSTGGSITGTGSLMLTCGSASTLIPSATQKLPAITKQGNFSLTIANTGLNAAGLIINAGIWVC